MTTENKRGRKRGVTMPGSRKWIMDRLNVGESAIFVAEHGESASRLQASLASAYRGGDSMLNNGLRQDSGLAVFPGEISLPIVRVTRFKLPDGAEPCA